MDFCFGCHQFIFFVIKAYTFYTKNFTFEQCLVFSIEFVFTGSACPFKLCFTFLLGFFPLVAIVGKTLVRYLLI